MALQHETVIEQAVLLNDGDQPGPKATLTARVRITNDTDEEIVAQADDFEFHLLGQHRTELERLHRSAPPLDPDRVRIPPGEVGEIRVPLRVEQTELDPNAPYLLSWELGEEHGKKAFQFL